MKISYAKKLAVYASVLKADPSISANALGRRYAGTAYALRKQDRNDFVKLFKQQLKESSEFKSALQSSDMTETTKKKLVKIADQNAYLHAKHNTRKSLREDPKKIDYKPVRDLGKRTFNRFGGYTRDYYEFYG